MGDYVVDPYHYAKFHHDTFTHFAAPPQICESAHQVTRLVFTPLNGMQTRSSDKNSVCPSVCQTGVLSLL